MSVLENKDRQFVWHPFTQHKTENTPIVITSAEGAYLIGEDGKRYLDANSSWWVNIHGHGNSHIGTAIAEQFSTLDHIVFAGLTHPKAIELSERILHLLPDHFSKVFFSDDGSTSVEVAIKMSFQYWYNLGNHKKRIVALEGAYHGDTFGAMSVGQRGYFNEPFEHLFFDVDFIPFPDDSNQHEILITAEELFRTGDCASIIVEPLVQGAAGMKMYSSHFLDELVRLARRYHVLVIFDEVMTGFGRTGKLFAMDHCSEKPDLVTLSKGLTGGVLPLGLTIATEEIYEAFLADKKAQALLHGHSFTGNALSCAASCASLDLLESQECRIQIADIQHWNENFAAVLRTHENVSQVRVCGTILAFEYVVEENGYFASIATRLGDHFISRGIFIRPLGNTLFINPPYCLTKEQYDQLSDAIIESIELI